MIKLIFVVGLLYAGYRILVAAMRPPPPMPRAEAARVLGLDTSAANEAVLDAHRRLIARVHPDAGGSAELAAQINRARDVMLKS